MNPIRSGPLQRLFAIAAVLVLLLGLVPTADAADALAGADLTRLEPALQSALQQDRRRDRIRVIVQREPARDRNEKRLREREVEVDLRNEGGQINDRLGLLEGHVVTLSSRAIAKLSRDKRIKAISLDHEVQLAQLSTVPLVNTATNLPGGLLSMQTATANAPQVWSTYGLDGSGVTVAVIDSGVAPSADLSNLAFGVDLSTGTTAPADRGGHGSHVAGIVAGNGTLSAGVYKGVATGARILSVKVTTDDGHASYAGIIKGLQWVIANKKAQNIRVVNMSLGAPASAGYTDDPLDAAAEIAWFRGIAVVASAGNSGPGPATVVVPGNDPYLITVGAYDDAQTAATADDLIPDWSSRGPTPFDGLAKPDLVASGRRVISLRSPGSFLDALMPDRVEGGGQYFRLSGTSMAAPVVAGVAALILQANPGLTPNQVKYILKQTARPMAGGASTVGAGAVDALAAVKLARQGVGEGKANKGQTPNRKTATAVWPVVRTLAPVWRNKGWWMGRYWSDAGWDQTSGFRTANGSWDDAGWDALAWANFNWEDAGWDDAGWDNAGWDALTWSDAGWDSGGWDSADWDSASSNGAIAD
ncbi:MAG TPA: S8 family peptidase [Chloroflexota bacterium]